MKVKKTSFGDKVLKEEISVNEEIFGLKVREDILNLVVRWQLLKKMSGNHKTKTLKEIKGAKAKPYKQKGTGNARLGNKKSTQMRGGVTIFGPVVRSHAIKLPKKVRRLGLKMALSSKVLSDSFLVVNDPDLSISKTSVVKKKLATMGINDSILMVVTDDIFSSDFKKSASNIKGFDMLPVQGLNVYDVLRHDNLLVAESAFKLLEERLK